jgi:PAS domain S-box-containing protein
MEETGMTVAWGPVVAVDIVGSFLTLIAAVVCASMAWGWRKKSPDDIFRDYMFLLTLAFVFFAVSRSVGHLLRHLLVYYHHAAAWDKISPFSGAANSAVFIVIFAFSLYFQRFQRMHLELRDYKDNLEQLVAERTVELENENAQRKKTQEELRQLSTSQKNIFNSAPPICITDMAFNLMETNEAYRQIWPASDHTGKALKCYESRPRSQCRTSECPMEQIARGEREVVAESTHSIAKGQDLVFLQTTRPFQDADGKLLGIVTSFQEITERIHAQKELVSERERLTVTLRSIGDGVITTDILGRVVILNKIAEQLCGWSQKEAEGRPLTEIFRIVNENTGKQCENPAEKVLETGGIVTLANHTVLISRNGTRYSIADSGAPICDHENRIIGVVLVFRDETDKQRLEKELFKTQKLESVGLLAGGIAHDFNNILTAILGNIELADRLVGNNHQVAPLLTEAKKASLRAKGLTQQLLVFAKGGSPVRKTVSIADIIKDSVVFILRGSNVRCELDVPDDLWLLNIDPDQMSQVIQNIIINAAQTMPEGGTIHLVCRNRPATGGGENSRQNTVEISITDTGPGINPGIIDKLFDPYFTTKNQGSGLGLSICHSIVNQHGGTISATSSAGKGATFTILLPVGEKNKQLRDDGPEEQLPGLKGARILLMDDDEMVSDVVLAMLRHLGHEAALARDGQEAIHLYNRSREEGRKFELIIMDLTIPGGMGGKEAVREIHKIDPQARVIVASGYSNDPIIASFAEYGFCAAVIKPFQLQDLAARIASALTPDKKTL